MSMKIYSRTVLFILAIPLLLLSACKTTQNVAREQIKEEGADFLFAKLKEHELKFEFISAKFSAEYEGKEESTSFNGHLRIRKDSLVWLSLTPMMGIEAIRVMVSQDSVKYINRISNTYFLGTYDALNRMLNTNIDYDILQSFLIGNDLSFYEDGKFKASIDDNVYKLTTAGRSKLKKYVKNSEEAVKVFIQNIWLDQKTFKISKADVKEVRKVHQRLEASYGSFDEVDSQLFPMEVQFSIYAENNLKVRAKFSKVTINEALQFPFKVPASFKLVNL